MEGARLVAIARDDVEAVRALLDAGTLEAAETKQLMFTACAAGSLRSVSLLLDRGFGVDEPCLANMRPLTMACAAGHVGVVQLLLSRGADPVARVSTVSRWTLLTVAAQSPIEGKAVAIARVLLRDGRLPVDTQCRDGTTALAVACQHGKVDMVRVLLLEGLADHTIADESGRTAMAHARLSGSTGCRKLLQVGTEGGNVVVLCGRWWYWWW